MAELPVLFIGGTGIILRAESGRSARETGEWYRADPARPVIDVSLDAMTMEKLAAAWSRR